MVFYPLPKSVSNKSENTLVMLERTKSHSSFYRQKMIKSVKDSCLKWNKRYYRWSSSSDYNPDGIDIFSEDWDNLIILDACRYDFFKAYSTLAGNLEYRISRASNTKQFIKANFRNKTLLDVAYFSDNPHYGRLYDEIGSNLYNFQSSSRNAFSGAVTHPKTLTDSAIDFVQEHENKRCIVHYLQPHDPYFAENGDELFALESKHPFELRSSGYTHKEIKSAYISSLKLVLQEVDRLLSHLDGKTVITADHGELLRDRLFPIPITMYEHPSFVYVEELVKVPWLVIDGPRKEIIEAESAKDWGFTDPVNEELKEQLEKLGYV